MSREGSGPFDMNYWAERWAANQIGFHESTVNATLLCHIHTLTAQPLTNKPLSDPIQFESNSRKTWFVPLCGKTNDIPFLLAQGFRVFGVEGVRLAVDALDQEHSLQMTHDETTHVSSGAGGRLNIYVGDLFQCPVEQFGPFDYVWDRGSFSAIDYSARAPYSQVMQRALKQKDGSWHEFRYLLVAFVYNKAKFEGPPKSVDDGDMSEFFLGWTNAQLLSAKPLPPDHRVSAAVGEPAFSRVFLFTPKR